MMFIIDLAWGLIQLVALAGGGLYVYKDYKNGWVTTKRLADRVQSFALKMSGFRENEVGRANKLVGDFAQQLDSFRRAVASIEADIQISEKQAKEHGVLAGQYTGLVEVALAKGDEETAAVAAEAKIQAERRMAMFTAHVDDQRKVVGIMREELTVQESNFDVMQTKAVTVQVRAQLAETKEKLYGLVSDVHIKSGLTPRSELERLLVDTERKDIQNSILLDMVKNSPRRFADRLLRSAEVEHVLKGVRQRLALPSPDNLSEDEEGNGEQEKVAGLVS